MTRPTDLYIADLLNQAADELVHQSVMRDPPSPAAVVEKLRAASKAVRETLETKPREFYQLSKEERLAVIKGIIVTPEQRFREADGQGSFHDEKPR